MKLMSLIYGILFTFVSSAYAGTPPTLYCVSTKTFNDGKSWPVNQINIFSNDKGTVKMSLQYFAWGQAEGEDATITTKTLLTLTKMNFDEQSQTLQNSSGKFALELGEEITAEKAKSILDSKDVSFSFEDPAGMLVEFTKYRLATLKQYKYPGKSEEWSATLMDAFNAGVNEYVCGDALNVKRN